MKSFLFCRGLRKSPNLFDLFADLERTENIDGEISILKNGDCFLYSNKFFLFQIREFTIALICLRRRQLWVRVLQDHFILKNITQICRRELNFILIFL